MTATGSPHLMDARTACARRRRSVFIEVAPWRVMATGPDPIAGSVPGAILTSVKSDFAGRPTASGGHLPLPEPAAVHATLLAHGVGPGDDLVLYTRRIEELSSAARAWFVLTWAGFRSVRVLDGGLPAWTRAGGWTDRAAQTRPPAPTQDSHAAPSFEIGGGGSSGIGIGGRRVLGITDVQEVADYGTLLDSRPMSAYDGALDDPRTGHVPHAVHAPSTELVAPDGLLRSPTEMRKWFLSRRAIGSHEVGAYCGGGVSSALLVFAGALLGQQVGLFVDSWSAWARDDSLPVEQGAAPTRSTVVDTDCA
ncbi:sulfurtransferase [Streptomyces dioscori]|uniref:Sulfurtransferase n=1 Tax=Streptomyces dioscori TaxID=2109333 RepID=A0A2P8Q840_9ACTN|nr:rhodanese-like domain-containing protein [Streptomyces dioscori]PSM42405.1 sulfurtransferase [Streptomyces dioscori]